MPPAGAAPPSANARSYVPRDRLFLWWLAQPEAPVLVGQLDMVRVQSFEKLQPPLPRHAHIGEQQIRHLLPQAREHAFGVLEFGHLQARITQCRCQYEPYAAIVVSEPDHRGIRHGFLRRAAVA